MSSITVERKLRKGTCASRVTSCVERGYNGGEQVEVVDGEAEMYREYVKPPEHAFTRSGRGSYTSESLARHDGLEPRADDQFRLRVEGKELKPAGLRLIGEGNAKDMPGAKHRRLAAERTERVSHPAGLTGWLRCFGQKEIGRKLQVRRLTGSARKARLVTAARPDKSQSTDDLRLLLAAM